MSNRALKLAPTLLIAVIAASVVTIGNRSPQATVASTKNTESITYTSDPFVIDRMYTSMRGPYKVHPITISKEFPPKLVWLRGLNFTATDSDGNPLDNQSFLCHGQIRYEDPKLYSYKNKELFGNSRSLPAKWFTVIQGQNGIEFPDGFGIPMLSNEPLEAMVMAINQVEGVAPVVLKMDTTLNYVYDDAAQKPMKPLGKFVVDIRVPVAQAVQYESHHENIGGYSTTCAIDEYDNVAVAKPAFENSRITKRRGQDVVFHFEVPPGKHTYRYQFPGSDYVSFPTTLHHISAHLHVYGEYIEILDVTNGNKQLFRSYATANEGMQFLDNMTEFTSREGIAFHPDHTYEIKAVYDNTTDSGIDAMAVMYFYYHDKAFEQGQLALR